MQFPEYSPRKQVSETLLRFAYFVYINNKINPYSQYILFNIYSEIGKGLLYSVCGTNDLRGAIPFPVLTISEGLFHLLYLQLQGLLHNIFSRVIYSDTSITKPWIYCRYSMR